MALQLRMFVVSPDEVGQVTVDIFTAVEQAFWPAVATVFWALIYSFVLFLAMPLELYNEEADAPNARTIVDQDAALPENLSEEDKLQMYRFTLGYQVERSIVIAAIEVSTLMLLETEYGLSVIQSSYLFSGVCFASTILMVACVGLLSSGLLSERAMCLGSALSAALGACMFFNFGGKTTLLVADFLVYGLSGATLGISEGWGTRAAMSSKSMTQTKWRAQAVQLGSLMRVLAPPLARVIVAYGGRNSYAAVQAPIVYLGLLTAYKCSSLLDNASSSQDPKADEIVK
jgi:hypothetical protein